MKPIAVIEDWPNDSIPIGIVQLQNLDQSMIGVRLYQMPDDIIQKARMWDFLMENASQIPSIVDSLSEIH